MQKRRTAPDSAEAGFTLVEVVIALIILTVGLLALASTSIFATTQIRVADLRTEESLAVQQVAERLHAMPFDSLASATKGAGQTVGSFTLWWDVSSPSQFVRDVLIYAEGPAYRNNRGWTPAVTDTFSISIANTET